MMFNKASTAYMTLGFELVGLILVAVFLGRWTETLGWGPWGLIGGIVFVFVGWLSHLYIVVQMLAKRDESGDTSGE